MTPLPAPSLPDRLRAHAHLHPESAELLREAADVLDLQGIAIGLQEEVLEAYRGERAKPKHVDDHPIGLVPGCPACEAGR